MNARTPQSKSPLIAFFDIETSPILGYSWEMWETNVISVVKESFLLSFAVQWEGSSKITTYALPDYAAYRRDKTDDSKLVKDLWAMMNKADIIVAHNGDSFDCKKSNARFIKHGFTPPAPYKTIDTLKIARRVAAFPSNKLDSLAKDLGIGRKLPHTGFALWEACMKGDPKAWRLMRKYNAHDVELLRGVYQKLRPWSPTGVNLALYKGIKGCPRCGHNDYQQRGTFYGASVAYKKLHCNPCGAWFKGESIKHETSEAS